MNRLTDWVKRHQIVTFFDISAENGWTVLRRGIGYSRDVFADIPSAIEEPPCRPVLYTSLCVMLWA